MCEDIFENSMKLVPRKEHPEVDLTTCFTKLQWRTGNAPRFQKLCAGVPSG